MRESVCVCGRACVSVSVSVSVFVQMAVLSSRMPWLYSVVS